MAAWAGCSQSSRVISCPSGRSQVTSFALLPPILAPRKNSRRRRGFRAEFTLLRVTEILTDGAKPSKQAANLNESASSEELRKYLENLGDDDLGRYKM